MEDREIVKALECCRTNLIDDCKRCNLRLEDGTVQPFCTTTLIGNALDLINRLQEENERLKKSLNIELENYATEYDNKIKAEAYKECIDMVKKKGVKVGVDEICFFEGTLDNLLKEMAGK